MAVNSAEVISFVVQGRLFLELLSYSATPSNLLSETQGNNLLLFVQSLLVLSDEFPHLRKEGAGSWKTRTGRKQVSGY